jgi:hypothetical protein
MKLAQLRQKLAGSPDKVPPKFFTVRQWASKWGVSRIHAGKLIKEGCEAKVFVMQPYRIWSGARLYPVPHYRERNE